MDDVYNDKHSFTEESKQWNDEDEHRLAQLGYVQEMKRVFGTFTNFGLASSMISVLLGIIPLYSYSLQTGGPVVMFWGWIGVGVVCLVLVSSLAEINSAFPTMGALYYWAYRLGGPKWGPFASWMAGWTNLLGQIAGVASGGYSGAIIIANIVSLINDYDMNNTQILAVYLGVLIIAGVVNTFTETLLTGLCYISVLWHLVGTLIIVITMLVMAPTHQNASFVLFSFQNYTNFDSSAYVGLIGILFAASTFTGYDTASHVSEETVVAHSNVPKGMILAVLNCLILGIIIIIGFNTCIQDYDELVDPNNPQEAYTTLWLSTVGKSLTIFFLIIVLVGIECSNCANMTSASRMVFSFARDKAIPFSPFFNSMDYSFGSPAPVRAIWFVVFFSFLLGLPGLTNPTVLGALFSLTATGLYTSYAIPIFLRITISRDSFTPAEFNLGKWSIPIGVVSVLWCLFMLIILCLPEDTPIAANNLNYSPIVLGAIIVFALIYWVTSARWWFKVTTAAIVNKEGNNNNDIDNETELVMLKSSEII